MAKSNQGIVFEDKRGNIAPLMRPTKGDAYEFDYTSTKGETAEITEQAVRIKCTSEAYIKIGETSAVAAASYDYDIKVNADEVVDIKLRDNEKYVSAVQVSAGGTCYVNGWV